MYQMNQLKINTGTIKKDKIIIDSREYELGDLIFNNEYVNIYDCFWFYAVESKISNFKTYSKLPKHKFEDFISRFN